MQFSWFLSGVAVGIAVTFVVLMIVHKRKVDDLSLQLYTARGDASTYKLSMADEKKLKEAWKTRAWDMLKIARDWKRQAKNWEAAALEAVPLLMEAVTEINDLRRQINELTPKDVKSEGEASPETDVPPRHVIYNILSLVEDEFPANLDDLGDVVDTWDDETKRAVVHWATMVHLEASDNIVTVPEMPSVLAATEAKTESETDHAWRTCEEAGLTGVEIDQS